MSDHAPAIDPLESLAALATRFAGAARVFQRHGLDYCCRGQMSLRDACMLRRLDTAVILGELRREQPTAADADRWHEQPVPALIDHLLAHFHERHRQELPRLLELAGKVERVHAAHPKRPGGLAEHLRTVALELEQHMQKEEQILFPMLRAGHGSHAAVPIQVMEAEHQDHGNNLARLRQLAHDFRAPADGCPTWRALYLGLEEFERDLMQHIHLENHVLFPRVLTP